MRFKTIQIDVNDANVFFVSDSYFMHKNIIEYCDRPFKTVDEMNSVMIKNWNNVVGKDDIVFHAGDFCFGSMDTWNYLLNALNGKKYFSAGNHDKSIPSDKFIDVQQMFNIRIMGDEEVSDGQRITVCHYPMRAWYQSHRDSWQLFGHAHGRFPKEKLHPNQLDVGVDCHEFTPISYNEVKIIITQQNISHEHN